jgi:hypothetical protein
VPGGLAVLLGELQRDDAEDGDEHAEPAMVMEAIWLITART